MNSGGRALKELAAALPDIPRWVEVRSMLLADTCEVFGVSEPGPSFGAVNPYTGVAVVVGTPPVDAIHAVVERLRRDDDLLAFDENLGHVTAALGGWRVSPAVLHMLSDSTGLPQLEPVGVGAPMARPHHGPHPLPVPSDRLDEKIVIRMMSGDEVADVERASRELRDELMRAALVGRVAATFVDGKAVSFCDAASETEALWDLGIETLAPYRGCGYAALAVSYMIDQQGRRGKRPVWGAEESNTASMRLAAKLGFRPVDLLYVLSRAP